MSLSTFINPNSCSWVSYLGVVGARFLDHQDSGTWEKDKEGELRKGWRLQEASGRSASRWACAAWIVRFSSVALCNQCWLLGLAGAFNGSWAKRPWQSQFCVACSFDCMWGCWGISWRWCHGWLRAGVRHILEAWFASFWTLQIPPLMLYSI